MKEFNFQRGLCIFRNSVSYFLSKNRCPVPLHLFNYKIELIWCISFFPVQDSLIQKQNLYLLWSNNNPKQKYLIVRFNKQKSIIPVKSSTSSSSSSPSPVTASCTLSVCRGLESLTQLPEIWSTGVLKKDDKSILKISSFIYILQSLTKKTKQQPKKHHAVLTALKSSNSS